MNSMDLLKFHTYKEYLENFVKTRDRYYLIHPKIYHKIVTLGYRTTNEVYTNDQFKKTRKQLVESLSSAKSSSILFSDSLKSDDCFLTALAEREWGNRQQIYSTIIFLWRTDASGFDITGYIDYAHSLSRAHKEERGATNWDRIFKEEIKLYPKKTDLSYIDGRSKIVRYNNSDNYKVIHDKVHGLTFMHRGDHKKIYVNSTKKHLPANFLYKMIHSQKYGYAVFMDHIVRKKI